jgi:PPOX class probable F420-dependent enzyme
MAGLGGVDSPEMTLKHRLANGSYRFLDRMRHKTAFDSAAQPGGAQDFAGLHGRKHALLVTFRSDGTAVPTPVWFGLLDDRRLVLRSEERTAKVRRIRRDPRAQVFPCDPRGKVLGPGVESIARLLAAEEECERAEAALDHRYGRARRAYHKLMFDDDGMIYLELSPAARPADLPPA